MAVAPTASELARGPLCLALLRELHGHCLEVALGVHWERYGGLEGLLRVDASGPWAVVQLRPLARVAADAVVHALAVVPDVQRGVPGVLVGLLEIDFSARDSADLVRVAVVICTVRSQLVLVQGREVERGVAAAAGPGHVRGPPHGLAQQLPRHVLGVVVDVILAGVRKVRSAAHVRLHTAASHLHLAGRLARHVDLGLHDGHRAIALHLQGAEAGARGRRRAQPEAQEQGRERPRGGAWHRW
mmetsp:Transcript_108255/g.349506  ORF Transcript_108255/g.349506 Transcript_108255/m.349506 type:complete len:243 (+) Transcript_108255:100-828(+)